MRGKKQRQAEWGINVLLNLQQDGTVACGIDLEYKREERGYERINKDFVDYYHSMGLVRDGEEWDRLLTSLQRPLPITFRIPRSASAITLRDHLDNCFGDLKGVTRPEKLEWYPDGLGVEWDVDSLTFRGKIMKKEESSERTICETVPERASLHAFILNETEMGHIVRQEAVSMIPALLLALQSHHLVLDLCAAPGTPSLPPCML